MFEVSASELTKKTDYVFIVSDSANAPDWSEVSNNSAKITRVFDNAELQTREIYFSVTKDWRQPSADASIDLALESENKYPGMLVPNGNYWVHAYTENSHAASSEMITTANYPDALPAAITDEANPDGATVDTEGATLKVVDGFLRAIWGMDSWRLREDGTYLAWNDELIEGSDRVLRLRRIEVNPSEVVYFPIRTIDMYPASPRSCVAPPSRLVMLYVLTNGNTEDIRFTYPQAGYSGSGHDGSVLYRNHYSESYYDIMHRSKATADHAYVQITANCGPGIDWIHMGYAIELKIISE